MIVTELLAKFANPDVMQTLSTSDKLTAGLITTLLGMGITFSALVILQFVISWMDKILNNSRIQSEKPTAPPAAEPEPRQAPNDAVQDDNELVAVIASVIAMKMKTSVDKIVIKNIEKIEDHSPAWNRAGIIEQMNSRL